MRTSILILALVAASLASSTPATAAEPGLYRGVWTSVDVDGSNQRMTIQGSGTTGRYAARLFDDAATTSCGGAPGALHGVGRADGDDLVVTGSHTCKPGGNPVRHRISLTFTYSAASDTLTDEAGVVWSRAS